MKKNSSLLTEADRVPTHLQTYNYEPPKQKKKSKVKEEIKEKIKKGVKKSQEAAKRLKKENSTMKTLVFPGDRKGKVRV